MGIPRWAAALLCAVLFLSLSALALAQDHGHAELPADCDIEALLAHQQEHAARLETLAEDLEHEPEAALENLYVTGIAYQLLAVECGFANGAQAEAQHNAEHGITASADVMAFAESIGDPVNGQVVFNTLQPEVGFACATCHRVDTTERLVGPGLAGIGNPAHDPTAHAEGEAGMGDMHHEATEQHDSPDATEGAPVERTLEDVEVYIRTSILHPSDFVVPGYPDNLMPQVYGDILTDQEINDLVAYLLTLQ